MAKRKKSGPAGVVAALVIATMAVLASVPKEVWYGVFVVAVIAIAFYLHRQSSKTPPAVQKPEPKKQPTRPATRVSTPPARLNAQSAPRSVANEPAARAATPPARPSAPPTPHPVDNELPVSVSSSPAPSPSGFKLPNAPKGFGVATWIPAGQSISVSGVIIPGGLVYVGTSLSTPMVGNDPCLINPSKEVARQGDYTVAQMGYWPNYAEISSPARRAYLNWLAGGRKDPAADVGFVFLFFYGLERRAIIDGAKDGAAQADWPVIAAELRRLLDIYGAKSASFRRYAGELLDWVSLASHPAKLYQRPVPVLPKTFELPIYIRLALGQAAVDGAPVPAYLALV